ncbi:GDP-Man:Man(3)GlcNAc(2)-PP-Dol alpha-1,2-mannosyltransferase [Strongyloides ratti]|uniref:GDP-Man:Man(3)GlcNAc(2)-PP-Dol alpha-1,2-mannosyltransferase n=1 Tax=Strongyloides ratti TaxID=34506 RepID=A0A090LID4_STRRB|nr:GDP-Man:Man(3)GlcNAc(2)-PP-Dol alpha-1,2-mannosyltransferase [Strongyloides ratti]CEF67230.2 GDP-Man:Man(3)GlcNAc(2)-PP-Dol alpha-1,2-mannosyltransferase [Strongyloides ratti]
MGILVSFIIIFFLPSVPFLIFLSIYLRGVKNKDSVAFFHPYCNAGGGGERVLWCALNGMQKRYGNRGIKFVIYSGDTDVTAKDILQKAKERFNVEVSEDNVKFIFLRWRWLLESSNYPRFTLILQTLAGYYVGLEGLLKYNPEIVIDTMGYPIILPLFKWIGGCKVACYVHYPTISTDMINLIENRKSSYNNAEWISKSFIFSYVMVNGSWTEKHINSLWNCKSKKVYPPCNVEEFLKIQNTSEDVLKNKKVVQILSVGQIRPEKNHRLQLESFAMAKKVLEKNDIKLKLIIVGGCRHEDDIQRYEMLKDYSGKLSILDDVIWKVNCPFNVLLELMSTSLIGIHTMINEHFGISVVEQMAAGNIMISHNSGGPLMDIVVDKYPSSKCRGFLATTSSEYSEAIIDIVNLSIDKRNKIREEAKKQLEKFSDINEAEKKVRTFKTAFDLTSFSFFQRGSVKEFMEFTGKLLVERSAIPARTSVKEQEYYCHTYVRSDGLSGVCVTDSEYQSHVAFTMLGKVLDDFISKIHPSQWNSINQEKDCSYTILNEQLVKWQNPSQADAMTRVQEEVEETKVILHDTIQSILHRGEKLDDIVKASESLSEQSKMFYTQAKKMNKCCNWT